MNHFSPCHGGNFGGNLRNPGTTVGRDKGCIHQTRSDYKKYSIYIYTHPK